MTWHMNNEHDMFWNNLVLLSLLRKKHSQRPSSYALFYFCKLYSSESFLTLEYVLKIDFLFIKKILFKISNNFSTIIFLQEFQRLLLSRLKNRRLFQSMTTLQKASMYHKYVFNNSTLLPSTYTYISRWLSVCNLEYVEIRNTTCQIDRMFLTICYYKKKYFT